MRILSFIASAIDRINHIAGQLASWLTVFVVLNVFVVVVMRYVFGVGHVWMQELYVWVHATAFMLSAGYTQLHDGHVRIDIFYREAGAKYKAFANLFGALVLGLPLMWVIFWRALPLVERSWMRGERSSEVGGLPALYLLKGVILVFAVLFGLQLLSLALRSLLILLGGVGSERKIGEELS